MKKLSLIILTIITSLICMNHLNAIPGYTTEAHVTVRTEPRVANETFVYQFPTKNNTLDIVSEELHNVNDPNCNTGWYQINYEGNIRYVCGNWVTLGETGDDNPNYNETTFEARIIDMNVTVRPTPTYDNNYIIYLLPGTNVRILDKVTGSGCSNGWYKIQYFKDSTGYVCSNYVKTKEELTSTNAEYETYLKNLGFPNSYIPYLVKLHEQHPSWKFNPIKTNADWNKLINVEINNNVVNGVFLNDIVNPVYQKGPHNEKNYYYTTDSVNAFFLDPRNFLTEAFIFMFERLEYDYEEGDNSSNGLNKDSNQTKKYYDILTSLLKNAYSNTDDFKYWFIGAGHEAKVSPVYLSSLSYQEGPLSNPENPSILGTHSAQYKEYESGVLNGKSYSVNGYYNFFNIGAYKEGVNSPVTRGLAYACGPACSFNDTYGRPWDTKEKAIYGGAHWIGDGYIANGQPTMYFKKFNSSPTSPHGIGAHQYQTNITAPCSESVKEYEAYKDTSMLDSDFTFDIPIYENMPEYVSLPEIASAINTLKEIKIDGKLISGFDIDVLDYVVYLSKSQNTVKIEVIKSDEASKVSGIGDINLPNDETEHQITVTAENGLTKTYKINFKKVEDTTSVEDIINSLSVKVNNDVMNHISPDTVANTLIQSILKYSPNAGVTIYSKTGSIVDGASLIETGGSIKITAPNGETKSYNTVVTGDTNGDGTVSILDLLRVQKHILGSTTLTDYNLKAADTNSDNKVDILDLLRVQKHILKSITL